jgi:hypothetical protein
MKESTQGAYSGWGQVDVSSLEVLDDSLDVPAGNKPCRRLHHGPSLPDELPQVASGAFGVNLVPEGGSCLIA